MTVPWDADKIDRAHTTVHRYSRLRGRTVQLDCVELRVEGTTVARYCGRLRHVRAWLFERLAERVDRGSSSLPPELRRK